MATADNEFDTRRFYEREPKYTGRYVVRHYEQGSIVYPEGSDQSIFRIAAPERAFGATPCVTREVGDRIVKALNLLTELEAHNTLDEATESYKQYWKLEKDNQG